MSAWTKETLEEWVQHCLAGPTVVDPFLALIASLQYAATYHRRLDDHARATLYDLFAELLGHLIEAIRCVEIDYDRAGGISPNSRGTIKNRKAEMDAQSSEPASRGKVRLGAVTLNPAPVPGLHSMRAVDHLKADGAEYPVARELREDEAWAKRAYQGKKRRA